MSIFTDVFFLNQISPRLLRFKKKKEYLWNFRCPFCQDSKKNKFKSRGYVYRKESNLFYKCHNCGRGYSFGSFLEQLDSSLYKQYILERYKNENRGNIKQPSWNVKPTKKLNINNNIFSSLNSIFSLDDNHIAKKYIKERKIPDKYWKTLYFCPDFKSFTNKHVPKSSINLKEGDERIIIPFWDKNNVLLGYQGRSFSKKSTLKYITIKIDEKNIKIWGLNNVNFNKKIYVLEGPFDSMFLNNSIARMSGTLWDVFEVVGKYDYTFIYDNQPRNKEVVKNMEKTLYLGGNICIFPDNIIKKDINEMIMDGMDVSYIEDIINKNTYSNLSGHLRLGSWKKT